MKSLVGMVEGLKSPQVMCNGSFLYPEKRSIISVAITIAIAIATWQKAVPASGLAVYPQFAGCPNHVSQRDNYRRGA